LAAETRTFVLACAPRGSTPKARDAALRMRLGGLSP
jgi:hypothetical protein